jgi:uncharacterized membrane protein
MTAASARTSHRVWEVLIVLLGVALTFFVSASIPKATVERHAGAAVAVLLGLVVLVLAWENRPLISRVQLRLPFNLRNIESSTGPQDALTDVITHDREVSELRDEVAALMGSPVAQPDPVRHQVALAFAQFKLSAPERSLLLLWARRALSGSELEYDVQLVSDNPNEAPKPGALHFELYCWDRNPYPRQRLMG